MLGWPIKRVLACDLYLILVFTCFLCQSFQLYLILANSFLLLASPLIYAEGGIWVFGRYEGKKVLDRRLQFHEKYRIFLLSIVLTDKYRAPKCLERSNLSCMLHTTRYLLRAQSFDGYICCLTRTSSVVLFQRRVRSQLAACFYGTPPPAWCRTTMLVEHDSMIARVSVKFHFATIAAATTAPAPRHGLHVGQRACSERRAPAWLRARAERSSSSIAPRQE